MSTEGAEGAKSIKSSMELTLEASIEFEKRRRRVVEAATASILDAVAFAGGPGCPRDPLVRHLGPAVDPGTSKRVIDALERAKLIYHQDGKLRITKSGIVEAQRLAAARAPATTTPKQGEDTVKAKTKADPKDTSVKSALIAAIERWPQKFRLRDPRGVTVRISPSKSTVGENGESLFHLLDNKTGEKVKEKVSEARLMKMIIRLKTTSTDQEPQGEDTVTKTEKMKAKKSEGKKAAAASTEVVKPKSIKRVEIFAKHKGKVHKAFLIDGLTVENSKGKSMGLPSAAAAQLTDGAKINGWTWWRYEVGGKRFEIAAIRAKPAHTHSKKTEAAEAPKAAKKGKKAKKKVAAAD